MRVSGSPLFTSSSSSRSVGGWLGAGMTLEGLFDRSARIIPKFRGRSCFGGAGAASMGEATRVGEVGGEKAACRGLVGGSEMWRLSTDAEALTGEVEVWWVGASEGSEGEARGVRAGVGGQQTSVRSGCSSGEVGVVTGLGIVTPVTTGRG